MSIKDTSFFKNLSIDDKILVCKILEWINLSENSYKIKFSYFLDERQCELLKSIFASLKFSNFKFYGGFENAKRQVVALFPSGYEIELDEFPFTAITFEYRNNSDLSHRDFLGALMALQIKREIVGDILIFDGFSVVFVYKTMSQFVLDNVSKIGSVGVKPVIKEITFAQPSERLQEITGTVASFRLDCIVSFVTKLNRSTAVDLIKKVGVDVEHINVKNPSFTLKIGCVFSIRGYGKFEFSRQNGVSKNQRIHILINKFI